jgi:hypothetical protein
LLRLAHPLRLGNARNRPVLRQGGIGVDDLHVAHSAPSTHIKKIDSLDVFDQCCL